jgi:hypothetical protein
MVDRRDGEIEAVRLPEDAARRLIARATELDARLATESSIADLRDAARQAGISDEAFQRALDEVRSESAKPVVAQAGRGTFAPRRFLKLAIVLLVIGAALAVVTARLVGPVRAPTPQGVPRTMPPEDMPIVPPPTTPPPTQVPPAASKKPPGN